MLSHKIQAKSAFTLVEIMVSLAIVAILGTVAFISYSSYTTNARDYKRLSDVSFLKTALDAYQKDHGGTFYVPETAVGTGVVYSGSLANPIAYQMDMNDRIAGVIGVSNVPTDPMNQGFYVYSVDAPKLNYQIATTFENSDTQTAYNRITILLNYNLCQKISIHSQVLYMRLITNLRIWIFQTGITRKKQFSTNKI